MKVALVHDWLNGMRGGEKVLEILCKLYPSAPLYTLLFEPEKIDSGIYRDRPIHSSWLQKTAFSKKYYRYCLPLLPAAMEKFSLDAYDLVISSSHCVAKGVRVRKGACHICYCHTPMRYLWDFQEEYFGRTNWVKQWMLDPLLNGLREWDVAASRTVDYFIANSRFVAERIHRIYGRDSEVIHPPVDTDFFTPAPGTEEPEKSAGVGVLQDKPGYYLIVSALVPYKKLDIALEAFQRIKDTLVIVGSGPLEGALRRKATPNVRFTGWVDPETLRWYYRHCRALIFPQKEDFGIVPLEAQACGKPVIALGEGGALETVAGHPEGRCSRRDALLTDLFGGGETPSEMPPTGIFFPRQTAESLLEALHLFERVETAFDSGRIRRHAMQFDREIFRQKLRDFIASRVPAAAEKVLQHA